MPGEKQALGWIKFDSGVGQVRYATAGGRFMILRPRSPSRTGPPYALYDHDNYVRHFVGVADAMWWACQLAGGRAPVAVRTASCSCRPIAAGPDAVRFDAADTCPIHRGLVAAAPTPGA